MHNGFAQPMMPGMQYAQVPMQYGAAPFPQGMTKSPALRDRQVAAPKPHPEARRVAQPVKNAPPASPRLVQSSGQTQQAHAFGRNISTNSPAQSSSRQAAFGCNTASPLSRSEGMVIRVRPMMEVRDSNMFEVSVKGALPMTKYLEEFETLSQDMKTDPAPNVPALRLSRQIASDPDACAQELQSFLNNLLSLGFGHTSATLKYFLGISVARPEPRRQQSNNPTPIKHDFSDSAMIQVSNTNRPAANYEKSSHQQSQPGDQIQYSDFDEVEYSDFDIISDFDQVPLDSDAASSTATTARESPPDRNRSSASSQSTNRSILTGISRTVERSAPAEKEDADFSLSNYRTSFQEGQLGQGLSELQIEPEYSRFDLQAETIVCQFHLNQGLSTWVTGTDDGYTFTQAISECNLLDAIDRFPAMTQSRQDLPSKHSALAPAPMEAEDSTSSRVASLAGYASSFRESRSKFAGGTVITDLEYESSLNTSPTAAPAPTSKKNPVGKNSAESDVEDSGFDEECMFQSKPEVIASLVSFLTGRNRKSTSFSDAGRQEEQIKAGIAICELSCKSAHNRDLAFNVGAVPVLTTMLSADGPLKFRMQEVAAACLSNLTANKQAKKLMTESDTLFHLQNVLCGENQRAAAQAAGALWGLCVGSDDNRQLVGTNAVIKALVTLVGTHCDDYALQQQLQSAAAGCLSECCIRNSVVKSKIASAGGIQALLQLCGSSDIVCQRLAACALCNLMANSPGNKRLARKSSFIREMSHLLKNSPVVEIQNATASCIYNIACKSDKEELVALELLPLLRSVKNTCNIDVKLLCVTSSVGEAQSPAFGTF